MCVCVRGDLSVVLDWVFGVYVCSREIFLCL